ncbi:hypothetical protein RHMOL_Rhmol04G0275800 [Rhododendron molle]|uniref:Uncharacterized protein n=1 Tax=Rhododendron molle TaxID=49168 RepID=A0ACC0P4Z3_RHOML|nr:hypothetical protein RHMOL_Rhmol04G0275800 [Rhododendron molle]
MAPTKRKQGDRPLEPQNEGLETQNDAVHLEQRVPENSQGNGSNPPVSVQSLSRQLAQVLSNLEDESAQELITLLRRVVTPLSAVDVDINGVVHEQVNSGDTLRKTPQQVIHVNKACLNAEECSGCNQVLKATCHPVVVPKES